MNFDRQALTDRITKLEAAIAEKQVYYRAVQTKPESQSRDRVLYGINQQINRLHNAKLDAQWAIDNFCQDQVDPRQVPIPLTPSKTEPKK